MIVAAGSEVALPRINLAAAPDFDLGTIRVKPSRRQICPVGKDCRDLEPRVMQVFVALAMARGSVVSRDQLIDACWEGRIVGDDSLNRCVLALRRLAREIDPQPFAIETVARVGYCLVENQTLRNGTAAEQAAQTNPRSALRRSRFRRLVAPVALAMLLLLAAGLLWRWQRPGEPEGVPTIGLAAVTSLSPDLPALTAQRFAEDVTAAFGIDDAVMLVTGTSGRLAPQPDLSLGGTIQKSGGTIHFTIHLRSERSGAALWSHRFERAAPEAALGSRQVSAAVAQVIRCGLAGPGPYLRRMSDRQLSLWLQLCHEIWSDEPSSAARILDAARRVTLAAPDFSRGWSMRSLYAQPYARTEPPAEVAALRTEAKEAANRALRLDPQNSEAYAATAASLVPSRRWGLIEILMRKAIAVRPTDCACEHHQYGQILSVVGRAEDAAVQYERFFDMQPLVAESRAHWAQALLAAGREDEGRRVLGDALALWPDAQELWEVKLRSAFWTARYDEALAILGDPARAPPAPANAAARAAFEVLKSGGRARGRAIVSLRKLADDPRRNTRLVSTALAALGDNEAALASAERNGSWFNGILFEPSFAAARRTPSFAALAGRLGLIRYWRESGRPPDFCREVRRPALCRAL